MIELILNLSLLVAISVVSGFIVQHWPSERRNGAIIQGVLFGGAAVLGMLQPLVLGPGLIFDGRSVMLSLCALFFGAWAAIPALLMAMVCRLWIGGGGALMGILVILSSAGIGLLARFRWRPQEEAPSTKKLYILGIAVHIVMLGLAFTLPDNTALSVLKRIGLPVIVLYPLATILVGKILSDQVSSFHFVEQLRESEKRYRTIFNESPVAIWEEDFSKVKSRIDELRQSGVADLRSYFERNPDEVAAMAALVRVRGVNRRSVELLGADSETTLIRELNKYFTDESLRVFKEEIIALAQGANLFYAEIPIVNNKGERMLFDLTLSVVPEHANDMSLVLVSFLDITGRKKAEEEKARLQTQLQQVQKMESIGQLAGGVAHDFNNMLSVILGHTELALMKTPPAEPIHADIVEISNAAKRSAELTRQLLAFARKQTIAPRVLDLNETVEGMLKMLHRLIGEDIDLAWKPKMDLWPVKMDPTQIDQILANLCVNARDAISGVGKMTIQTGNSVFDEDYCIANPGFLPGEYVMLAVSDNGRGMDRSTMMHIFEPFFTTKGVGEGTGLGLATVYGIVKQNNGFINTYSELGSGTTFKIYLPRHNAGLANIDKKDLPKHVLRGHETILLVEDDPAILKMTRIMLETHGYSVLAASTPTEAILAAREHAGEIDLLMTDVVMPEMNGCDLAGKLMELYPKIKRLFMSGYSTNVISHHGVLDEKVYFLQKPFSIEGLTSKLRETLD